MTEEFSADGEIFPIPLLAVAEWDLPRVPGSCWQLENSKLLEWWAILVHMVFHPFIWYFCRPGFLYVQMMNKHLLLIQN